MVRVSSQHTLEHTVNGFTEIGSLLDRLAATKTVRAVSIERAEGMLVEHLLSRGEHLFFCISEDLHRGPGPDTKSDAFDAFVLAADTLRHEHSHWRPLTACSR